jgi:UDP-GlcNAc3NAcA epimerase
MKVASIVGARPQFVKAAMLCRALGRSGVLIHTGQHYDADMSDVFFRELEIPRPRHHLGIGSGSHGAQTGRMLEAVERVLLRERPDWVVVLGDTNSTLAGALAAAKLRIPVAHVEAGLRSFNREMAEEHNRVLADHLSDALFAPTARAVENLRNEGIPARRIRRVGDVMFDAALHYGSKSNGRILGKLALEPKNYILATVHRAENVDRPERLRAILDGLSSVRLPVVLPLHPRTRSRLRSAPARLRIVDPLGYLDMVALERNARLIATDSGGVQKEAFFYRVPCVTLRTETEWVELVELGWNRVVPPTSARRVARGIEASMDRRGSPSRVYGDGRAARRIVEILRRW